MISGTSFKMPSLVVAIDTEVLGLGPRLSRLDFRTRSSSCLDAASGSAEPTMALTTATPSRGFLGELPRNMTCITFEALRPPMQTAGTLRWPRSLRTSRVCRRPSGPITDLVSFFLEESL